MSGSLGHFFVSRPNPAEPSGSEPSSSSRPSVPTCEVSMEGQATAEDPMDEGPGATPKGQAKQNSCLKLTLLPSPIFSTIM